MLDGTELAVPQAHLADRIVVPARTEGGGVALALRRPKGRRASRSSAPRRPTARSTRTCHLAGVAVAPEDVLVGPVLGDAVLDFVLVAATIALCALQVGVCEAALTKTAAYLNTRQQFGRPLSTFQGTMLRAADAAIDIEAMRVTWQNAAWRFDTGRDAADAARVAKWQASERGQRAVHATQHLHGGHRGRHLLPDPPLLPVGQADRAALGWPERAAGATRRSHRRTGPRPGGGSA